MNALPPIEINPAISAVGSVIWLHGLGADGHDFAPIVSELNLQHSLPLRFIFPHAPIMPVTINNGYMMRAWYDIFSLAIDQKIDETGIAQSVELLQGLIKREMAFGIPVNKIVLAGFSQGAVIALATGLTFPERLAGILALSGYLPQPEKILREASIKTPVFLGHGKEDTIVPHCLGEQLYRLLEKNNWPVNWHSYAMPHSVCPQEIQDIARWLQTLFY